MSSFDIWSVCLSKINMTILRPNILCWFSVENFFSYISEKLAIDVKLMLSFYSHIFSQYLQIPYYWSFSDSNFFKLHKKISRFDLEWNLTIMPASLLFKVLCVMSIPVLSILTSIKALRLTLSKSRVSSFWSCGIPLMSTIVLRPYCSNSLISAFSLIIFLSLALSSVFISLMDDASIFVFRCRMLSHVNFIPRISSEWFVTCLFFYNPNLVFLHGIHIWPYLFYSCKGTFYSYLRGNFQFGIFVEARSRGSGFDSCLNSGT